MNRSKSVRFSDDDKAKLAAMSKLEQTQQPPEQPEQLEQQQQQPQQAPRGRQRRHSFYEAGTEPGEPEMPPKGGPSEAEPSESPPNTPQRTPGRSSSLRRPSREERRRQRYNQFGDGSEKSQRQPPIQQLLGYREYQEFKEFKQHQERQRQREEKYWQLLQLEQEKDGELFNEDNRAFVATVTLAARSSTRAPVQTLWTTILSSWFTPTEHIIAFREGALSDACVLELRWVAPSSAAHSRQSSDVSSHRLSAPIVNHTRHRSLSRNGRGQSVPRRPWDDDEDSGSSSEDTAFTDDDEDSELEEMMRRMGVGKGHHRRRSSASHTTAATSVNTPTSSHARRPSMASNTGSSMGGGGGAEPRIFLLQYWSAAADTPMGWRTARASFARHMVAARVTPPGRRIVCALAVGARCEVYGWENGASVSHPGLVARHPGTLDLRTPRGRRELETQLDFIERRGLRYALGGGGGGGGGSRESGELSRPWSRRTG